MTADCLFCKIAAKQIPAKIVYEDPDVFAFEDIGPQAPTHLLICPRKHIASLDETSAGDELMLGRLQTVAAKLARDRNLAEGYRTVVNTGRDAGQSVLHLHLHLLGGRSLRWPPG
jgi:histidine triad (HIT) family protein